MKRTLLCFFLLIIEISAFSQQTEISSRLTKEDFLRKSRHQHGASMVFGLPGSGLIVIGGYILVQGLTDETLDSNERRTLMFLSLGSFCTGAVLLIIANWFGNSSVRNKNKAVSLGLRNQFIPQFQGTGFAYHPIPSLVLKIHL